MKPLGKLNVEKQFHGSPSQILSFDSSQLKSLGFHFGDIHQARHFAGRDGFIHECDLSFKNIVDIGEQDWGWTCAAAIAFAFFLACISGGIPTTHEDFVPFLGPVEGGWSRIKIKITPRVSADEQRALVDLFTSYGFDGVRYTNNFEPPDMPGAIAYFVTTSKQITIRKVVSGLHL